MGDVIKLKQYKVTVMGRQLVAADTTIMALSYEQAKAKATAAWENGFLEDQLTFIDTGEPLAGVFIIVYKEENDET